MSNINDKAPAGATHRYEHGGLVSWYRKTDSGLFTWRDGSWFASFFRSAQDLAQSCMLGRVEAIPAMPALQAEDDLTWLSRNVHEWLGNADFVRIHTNGHEPVFVTKAGAACGGKVFTKDQWLARRAELQNKPSWADAPEWAQWLAQDSLGRWLWHERKPKADDARFTPRRGVFHVECTGEVLGDWRDTLERRPVDLSEAAVTERLNEATQTVLAAVPGLMDEKYLFEHNTKPVSVANETVQLEQPWVVAGTGAGSADIEQKAVAAEDLSGKVITLLRENPGLLSANELAELHQLCDAELTKRDAAVCGGQKYIDAHWFERGELPPVGVWVEAFCDGAEPEKCKIIAYHKQQVAVQWSQFNHGCLDVLEMPGWDFRPIRTDADRLKDLLAQAGITTCIDQAADAILAAGFKRGEA